MAAAASESEATGDELEVIQFTLSGHTYAIPVGDGNSIIEPKPTTRVPRSSDAIDGVMDYRGEVAVIVDLHKVLGIEREGSVDEDRYEDRIIILDDAADNQTVGIRTETVIGVESLPEPDLQENVQNLQSETSGVDDGLLKGVFTLGEDDDDRRVVELLDIGAVLTDVRESSRMEFQQTK